jgi:hypothetical protein
MHKYTVYQVANMLDTSHTTIYKKLKNKEVYKQLSHCITKQGRHTYLSLEGIEILKKHIQPKETVTNNLETEVKEEDTQLGKTIDTVDLEMFINSLETSSKQLIESMAKQIEALKEDKLKLYEQLEMKDKQLETRDTQIIGMTKLVENSQILLKQQQDKIFFLESGENQKETSKPWWRVWK